MSSIQCIFADGFIDDTLKEGTSLNATILEDHFHLFIAPNAVWKISFKEHYGRIHLFLNKMVYASNEEEFDKAYDLAFDTLKGKTDHITYLKTSKIIGVGFLNIWLKK